MAKYFIAKCLDFTKINDVSYTKVLVHHDIVSSSVRGNKHPIWSCFHEVLLTELLFLHLFCLLHVLC